jgi:hypothetical protein
MDEITLKSDAESLANYGKSLTVQDHDDYMCANGYLLQNKAKQKAIAEYFDPEIESANKTHKGLCSKKKVLLEPLVENYKKVAAACSNYILEQERIRDEEKKQREAEEKAKAEATQAVIIATAEKEEKAGDVQCASDLMEQAQDIVPAEVMVAPIVTNTRLTEGSTSWSSVLDITVINSVDVYEAVRRGEFPITCVEISVKTSVLKKYFEGKGIKSYNANGLQVKEIKSPNARVY